MSRKRKAEDPLEYSELLGGKYQILEKIGSGSFGDVHTATDVITGEMLAVKIESHKRGAVKQLEIENQVYKQLKGISGIPHMRWFGELEVASRKADALVLDRLGPSLEDILQIKRAFDLSLTLNFGDQALRILEDMHGRHYIHRDIKPDNFLFGPEGDPSQTKVFLVDFGLAARYRNNKRQHIPFRSDRRLTGTARYASINSHRGLELSRRDDLESLGYLLVYFLKGRLPWQGKHANNTMERYELIASCKIDTSLETLCNNLPAELIDFLKYCRGLRFDENPDYAFLRRLLRIIGARLDPTIFHMDPMFN